MDVAALNHLRRKVRSHWEKEADQPTPLLFMFDEDGSRDDPFTAFRTIASELGLRYLNIGLADGLTAEHEALLKRPSPKLITLYGIEMMPAEHRISLHARLCSTGRALPIVIGFLPADRISSTLRAWHSLKDLEQKQARRAQRSAT